MHVIHIYIETYTHKLHTLQGAWCMYVVYVRIYVVYVRIYVVYVRIYVVYVRILYVQLKNNIICTIICRCTIV